MANFMTLMSVIGIVGLVFTVWGFTISDYETNYVDRNLTNVSKVSDDYRGDQFNRTLELNNSFSKTKEAVEQIQEADNFFKVLGGGLVVVSLAFVELIPAIFVFLAISLDQISAFALLTNIPQAIAVIGISLLFIYMMLKIINSVRKWDA